MHILDKYVYTCNIWYMSQKSYEDIWAVKIPVVRVHGQPNLQNIFRVSLPQIILGLFR